MITIPTEHLCRVDHEEIKVLGQNTGVTTVLFEKVGVYMLVEQYNSFFGCWEVLKIRKP